MLDSKHNEDISARVSLLDLKSSDSTISSLLESFRQAQSTKDLHDLSERINGEIENVDKALNQFMIKKKNRHHQEISNIDLKRARLSSTVNHSDDLSSLLSSADGLGYSLTYKIKSLDREIGNVDSTLQFVKDIQLLRNNLNQANYAIEHSDWVVAAECIHNIKSNLSEDLINGRFASVVIPSTDLPEFPSITLDKWISQLTSEFQKRFREASKERNVPEITKYFQLFPLINQEKAGLNCYSEFIGEIIRETSRNLISSITGEAQSNPGLYSTIAIELFENISIMLSQHGPLIKKYYGLTYENAIAYVVTRIQHEVDSQIGLISDTFYDVRKIDKILQEIDLYSFPILSRRQNDYNDENNQYIDVEDNISLVEVGDLVNELASILHHWSLYSKFITLQYYKEDSSELKLPNLILESNFTRKIHEKYLPAFESMYCFYFRRSIEKSITIEELPSLNSYLSYSNTINSPDQAPCSSVIEDTTLILNNTLRNVIDTSIPSTVKRFIRFTFDVIQNDLINGFLIKNLNNNQPRYNQTLGWVQTPVSNGVLSASVSPGASRSGTPVPELASSGMGFLKGASSAFGNVVGSGATSVAANNTGGTVNSLKLTNFVIYINTVAMSQEYFTKVFGNVTKSGQGYLKSVFPFGKDNEIIDTILKDDFLTPFVSITNKITNDSLINLYNQSFKNKLLILINEFLPDSNESNYILYSSSMLNDSSSVLRFHNSWRALIGPYKQTFHKALFSKWMRLLVVNIANLIEKKLRFALKKFKVNELGSIKLEKDLSQLINEVCEDNYELREKFIRVTQIVLLVGMDDDEYDMSTQNDTPPTEDNDQDNEYSGINWVLTPEERRQIRSHRI
ncbi:uncharacterized protein PRCAT00004153001 [Priceomyces carsonii]|uniref:uncharacterized protein n=1 Tax=Priceomyces carsonii TaxID=28549 RepID=UPI002ED8C392|nr:unnamed protein product [Priceomyces carsonii]